MPRTSDECMSVFCPPSELLDIRTNLPRKVTFFLRSAMCLALLFTFHALLTKASAQSTTATLNGTVGDEAGAVIPDVNIAVIDMVNGFERSATTNSDGVFVEALLPLGNYTVKADHEDFTSTEQRDVVFFPYESFNTLAFLFLNCFVCLALFPMFKRDFNTESSLRTILTFGMSGASLGASIGGGVADSLSVGLGGPAALIGAPIGFLVGTIVGAYVEESKKVLTVGEVRQFLIHKQSRYPALTLEKIIEFTSPPYVRNECSIRFFHVDGVVKCTKADLLKWLESDCWRTLIVSPDSDETDR